MLAGALLQGAENLFAAGFELLIDDIASGAVFVTFEGGR
jgi:hypothetical protein